MVLCNEMLNASGWLIRPQLDLEIKIKPHTPKIKKKWATSNKKRILHEERMRAKRISKQLDIMMENLFDVTTLFHIPLIKEENCLGTVKLP